MSNQQPIKTAADLSLMVGFPPAQNQRVTHANQLLKPYNRWSFQNELKLNCTSDVWRGGGAVLPFEIAPRSLNDVTYRNGAGDQFTFDDMVDLSYTDGIIVLHQGKMIYERYLNGMQPHTLHAWASASKSMTGTLAAMLAHEGLFDLDALVLTYLPELTDSGFGDATVRQVMDMTAAVGFADDHHDPDGIAENWRYGLAMGWRAKPDDYDGPQDSYAFLPTIQKNGVHGEKFTYLTLNTDVISWLIRRLTGQTLADLMRDKIWMKLGAERDAFWIVDSAAAETAGSGLISTLPDMARFGQMMLQRGAFNGQQIVPSAVIEDIENGADKAAFSRSMASSPGNRGYSYHNQWWNTHSAYGAYQAIGYGGQILYIAPAVQLVVAKFSSYPTPTPAGNEFYSAFAALPALAETLSKRG